MNAASPGVIALFQPNDYYQTQDDYLEAARRGHARRVRGDRRRRDHPADRRARPGDGPPHDVQGPLARGVRRAGRAAHRGAEPRAAQRAGRAGAHARVLGQLRRPAPPRHRRWSSLLPIVLKAKPQGLLFEAANPRHAHEWAVFKEVELPEDKVLIPGRARDHHQLRRAPASWSPSASSASPTSSAASGSSPAPTAASAPSPASARSSRISST